MASNPPAGALAPSKLLLYQLLAQALLPKGQSKEAWPGNLLETYNLRLHLRSSMAARASYLIWGSQSKRRMWRTLFRNQLKFQDVGDVWVAQSGQHLPLAQVMIQVLGSSPVSGSLLSWELASPSPSGAPLSLIHI